MDVKGKVATRFARVGKFRLSKFDGEQIHASTSPPQRYLLDVRETAQTSVHPFVKTYFDHAPHSYTLHFISKCTVVFRILSLRYRQLLFVLQKCTEELEIVRSLQN